MSALVNDRIQLSDNAVFALDIGTRSIIGMVGVVENEKVNILAIETAEHTQRSMIDGQIEDIDQVAKLVGVVKGRLENRIGFALRSVCIAAAGRTLVTQKATYEIQLPEPGNIGDELISQLEAGAISKAEADFSELNDDVFQKEFFLVGYSVLSYYLDNYNMSNLLDHKGSNIKADVIATFLPREVVDSLYTAMHKIGLEVSSLTLEPIAAINAAISRDLRLLNLVLVDIGAGTSDIAVCRDGSIVGYTMATLAGDEVTEALMKYLLIDFNTAEKVKALLATEEDIPYTDILGIPHTIKSADVMENLQEPMENFCKEVASKIVEVNGGVPSAVFLAGGGSKMTGIQKQVAAELGMDINRVAIAGNNFGTYAFSDDYDLNNPEYATPLGIAISSGLNMINDSFRVTLNGKPAKLFKNGVLSIRDILMMNGYNYKHMIGKPGKSLAVTLNGQPRIVRGGFSSAAVIRLNGNEAKITDIVHAGDVIEFEPALSGEDAKVCVSDLIDVKDDEILVNGESASADTPLKMGDTIVTTPSDQAEIERMAEEMKDIPDNTSEEKPGVINPTGIFVGGQRELKIMLNDVSKTFPPKKGGAPYYLMDMIEHSGVDADNVNGRVILKVNGEECPLLEELKENDQVEIFCEPNLTIYRA